MDGEKHGMTPPATGVGLVDLRNRGFLEMLRFRVEVQHVNTCLSTRCNTDIQAVLINPGLYDFMSTV